MNVELTIFLLASGLVTVIFVVTELKYWFNAKKDEKNMKRRKPID